MSEQEYLDKCSIAAMKALLPLQESAGKTYAELLDKAWMCALVMLKKRRENKPH